MRTTFLNPALDEQLDRDGYVVVPLLEGHEVERLSKAYESLGVAPGDPQRACVDTFHCFDADYKDMVHAEVEAVLGPAVDAVFDRHKSLSFCYIQKWNDERSGFGLHQDISVIDEQQYRSVEVWCALVDTDEENGQLWVVPGSHRWAPDNVRGIHGFPPAWAGLEERIATRHALPVAMKAGEAVIFCHSTCHFSYANRSDGHRLVAATDMIPAEAQALHYVAGPSGNIDVYEIAESFWVHQNPFTLLHAPDHLRRVDEVDPVTFTRLTDADLDRLVAEGLAVDHEPIGVGPINPDLRWCHRCGTTEGVEGWVDQFNGNVTLLCPRCEAAQARMASAVGDIDVDLLRSLDEDGYAVVELFGDDELASARAQVDTLGIDSSVGFYAMNQDAPRPEAVRVDRALQAVAQLAIDRVLPGFRTFKAIPLVKGARGDNPVGLHQDWEYVDERNHRGYSIWCPLDGADSIDGGLRVVPGSHQWLANHRGSGFDTPFEGVADEIVRRVSREVVLQRGQAIVYDNALLHHSPPNCGRRTRVAVAFAIAPPGAPVIHLHRREDGQADVFDIRANDDFFTEQPFGSSPSGPPMRTIEVAVEPVTLDDLDRWLAEPAGAGDSEAGTSGAAAPRRGVLGRWRHRRRSA